VLEKHPDTFVRDFELSRKAHVYRDKDSFVLFELTKLKTQITI
jgi:hypothetical protein